MCTACMEITTLIHDTSVAPNPEIGSSVLHLVRSISLSRDKIMMSEEEIAVFLIILGGSLLVWENTNQ